MCLDCGRKLEVCTKCCQSKEIVPAAPGKEEQLKLDEEMKAMLQTLPERKRRTFIRYMNRNGKEENEEDKEKTKDDLVNKLHSLKVGDGFEDLFSDDDDFDDDDVESS